MKPINQTQSPLTLRVFPKVFSWARIWTVLQVAKERRALGQLDRHMLEDLGLTEADVIQETGRAFWDLPFGR